jgi:hypothetical protein
MDLEHISSSGLMLNAERAGEFNRKGRRAAMPVRREAGHFFKQD